MFRILVVYFGLFIHLKLCVFQLSFSFDSIIHDMFGCLGRLRNDNPRRVGKVANYSLAHPAHFVARHPVAEHVFQCGSSTHLLARKRRDQRASCTARRQCRQTPCDMQTIACVEMSPVAEAGLHSPVPPFHTSSIINITRYIIILYHHHVQNSNVARTVGPLRGP